MKIQFSQLHLSLSDYPFKVQNVDQLKSNIIKSIDEGKVWDADIIIFPEYTYLEELDEMYSRNSSNIFIIAGSHHSNDDFSETIIFYKGEKFKQAKRKLSPYEKIAGSSRNLNETSEEPKIFEIGKDSILILTCSDFYHFSRSYFDKIVQQQEDISLLISPCCNENVKIFLDEAQANHNRSNRCLTIIVNVSSLTFNSVESSENKYGHSAIFGDFDPAAVNSIKFQLPSKPEDAPSHAKVCLKNENFIIQVDFAKLQNNQQMREIDFQSMVKEVKRISLE